MNIPWSYVKCVCNEKQIEYFNNNSIFDDLMVYEGLLEDTCTAYDIEMLAIYHIWSKLTSDKDFYNKTFNNIESSKLKKGGIVLYKNCSFKLFDHFKDASE